MFKVKGDFIVSLGVVFKLEVYKDVIIGGVYGKGIVFSVIFKDIMVFFGLNFNSILSFFVDVLK